MKVPGGIKFVGEMIGIVDGPSAVAAVLSVGCFFGMRAGMKIMNDRTMMYQQMKMQQEMQQFMGSYMNNYMNEYMKNFTANMGSNMNHVA